MKIVKRLSHDFLEEEVEKDWREKAPLPNPDCGSEELSDVTIEEDCTASGVVECLNDLNESFFDAEASHDVP